VIHQPLCSCQEPPADETHYPDDMHVHETCRVYHAGRTCTIPPVQPELPLRK
jgi:hypothetical protein